MELIDRAVVVVNKQSGPTSQEVVSEIKKILNCKKAGHAGTLDASAKGVLLVALNDAVKAMPVLMGLDKEYDGVMYLHKNFEIEKLKDVIAKHFIGEIIQIPPVKSRVARVARKRRVYSFEILDVDGRDVKFRTKVEAGTYIRKLVSDIGEKLGVGAHLKELTRTKVGNFSIMNSFTLKEIERDWNFGSDKVLSRIFITIEEAIPHVKRVYVNPSFIPKILNGSPVRQENILRIEGKPKPEEIVGIFSPERKLIALGVVRLKNNNLLIQTDRVIGGS